MVMGQFGLTRRGVLALPLLGLGGPLGAKPISAISEINEISEEKANHEAAALAKQALELSKAAQTRLIWKFCTFDIPEATALIDRVYSLPLNQAEEQRLNFNLITQRAAAIASRAMAQPHSVAEFPMPTDALVLGNRQQQVNPVYVLHETLKQMADVGIGLHVEWTSPWPSEMKLFRALHGTRRVRPNATQKPIEGALLNYFRDTGNIAINNGTLLGIASTCAQLGSGVLGGTAMARIDFSLDQYGGNQQDLANDISYYGLLCLEFGDLAGARNALNRLKRSATRFELAVGVAMLEVHQLGAAAGLRRLNELSEAVRSEQASTPMESVNRIQILVTTFVELGRPAWAKDCAGRYVKQLRETAKPDLYVLATMSVIMLYLGEQAVAVELCQRGHDVYRQTAVPTPQHRASAPIAAGYQQLNDGNGYPSHYYLAFSAYWAGLTNVYDSIAQSVPEDRRETFWVWFLDMGTNLSLQSPPHAQAISAGGPGLWVPAIRRAIAQGRDAESLALIPLAAQSLCRSKHTRRFQDLMTLAHFAKRLSQPRMVEEVLNGARQAAQDLTDPEKRIDAMLLILQTDRALARTT